MISIKNLSKAFNGVKILESINVEIQEGELVVILGESGTGKSVLLKHLMGLLKPDQGSILIDGVDITKLEERELLNLRKDIGFLFQEGALYDYMTVNENIAFPLKEHTAMNKQQIREKVSQALAMVDLEGVDEKFPAELSGGMRKRVGLARAIVLKTKILYCDEPTSGLDPIRSRAITDLISNVSKKLKCTTVITSHDIENSFRMADRLALIGEGKVIAFGRADEIKASGNKFVQEFIR